MDMMLFSAIFATAIVLSNSYVVDPPCKDHLDAGACSKLAGQCSSSFYTRVRCEATCGCCDVTGTRRKCTGSAGSAGSLGSTMAPGNAVSPGVLFSAYPPRVTPGLTEALSLRCSLAPIALRQVTSILVSYTDDHNNVISVASVTSTDAAMTFVDPGNLEAKGSTSGTSGDRFLQLTWADPSRAYIGEYTCTVTGVDDGGHIVTMTSQVTLTEVAPSIKDLVTFFNSKIQAQSKQIEVLEKVNAEQQQKNADFTKAIELLQQENARLGNCTCTKT